MFCDTGWVTEMRGRRLLSTKEVQSFYHEPGAWTGKADIGRKYGEYVRNTKDINGDANGESTRKTVEDTSG